MTIPEKIQSWLDDAQMDLAKNYEKIEPYGIFSKDENWGDLLSTELKVTPTGYTAQIFGPYYTYWLEHGRGPTKNKTPHNPTVREVVLRWIKKYNIQAKDPKYNQATLAYFISKNIHEKGIKVPDKYNPGGIVSSVITNDRFDILIKSIGDIYIKDVKSDILKSFK